jgi:hypothetical protein
VPVPEVVKVSQRTWVDQAFALGRDPVRDSDWSAQSHL